MINVVNLWHHYGIKPILKDVSFTVEPGELVAIMGPNGMGKSTLLALLGGVLWPIKGYVEIDGHKRRNSIEEENSSTLKIMKGYATWDSYFHSYILRDGKIVHTKNMTFYVNGRSALGKLINYYFMGNLMKHRGLSPTQAIGLVKLWKSRYILHGFRSEAINLHEDTEYFFWEGYNNWEGMATFRRIGIPIRIKEAELGRGKLN